MVILVHVNILFFWFPLQLILINMLMASLLHAYFTDKNHGLPDNLERIEICFSLPSTEELFSQISLVCILMRNLSFFFHWILLTFVVVSQVCAAEELKVNPASLEQLTMFSGGDIRKAIMQLQFWFQSKPKRGILDVYCYRSTS